MNLLFDSNKTPLTESEINKIVEDSQGLSDQFCRLLTYWAAGMIRTATDLELIRQSYFQLINQELQKGKKAQ